MTQEMLADHYHLVAPTAPHFCDIPDCPGPVTKRKLEAFDDLLAALRLYVRLDNDLRAGGEIDPADWAECYQAAQAAIARASPQAR